VRTQLGMLAVRDDLTAAPRTAVTVLIRPEQLDVRPGAGGEGAHGQVISTSFHGHDTLISIGSGNEAVPSPILVRVHGNPQLRPGSAVTLSVREPVCAWPCGDPG
jgi:iron(III) transport system ATP-binding protein